MKIRGQRECKECGTEWSYYDTGAVSCPSCGSRYSVGTEADRTLHTASAATLDLTPVRSSIDAEPLDRIAERAGSLAREFTQGYGFIDGGRLQPLDETYLAATELRHVAEEFRRRMEIGDEAEWYFTALLRADGGERPDPAAVPSSLRAMRGLAYANACREYRSDLRTYVKEHPDPLVDGPMERLSNHIRRIRALDGDVSVRQSEALVTATRTLGEYLIDGEKRRLAVFEEQLDTLE